MKNNGRRRLIAIGIALVILGLLTTGCGKKGDPIPPRIKPVAAVTSSDGNVKSIHIGAKLNIPGKGNRIPL